MADLCRRGAACGLTVVACANDFKLMMIVVAPPVIFLLKRSKARPGEAAILE